MGMPISKHHFNQKKKIFFVRIIPKNTINNNLSHVITTLVIEPENLNDLAETLHHHHNIQTLFF